MNTDTDILSCDELMALRKVLEAFENREYVGTGMRGVNGGYAKADMADFDEELIYIELEWGRQDMGDGHSTCHIEQCQMPRIVLLKDMSMAEKVAFIESRRT